ncbi:MAG: protein-glutamate O-methyltransferase CheR [Victivallales bacterium]|nr:protein-glutamate O-methyltransferase CheR [Victivallales bacterium]
MVEQEKNLEKIEIDALLEALHQHYGYDFRNYAKASITRRIKGLVNKYELEYISELIPLLLHNKEKFKYFVYDLSIPVTEMFRDYQFFLSIRNNAVPHLKTYPHIKIWHAGCATGEEVYSMAIILEEENVLKRSTLYATDFNDTALKKAGYGVYDLANAQQYSSNYRKAGGKCTFADYYYTKNHYMIMENRLKKRLVFSNHNLTGDGVFSEVQLIMCRNVLIYFDKQLQNRVLELFTEALVPGGILALGSKETLNFTAVSELYEPIDKKWKIYKKKFR